MMDQRGQPFRRKDGMNNRNKVNHVSDAKQLVMILAMGVVVIIICAWLVKLAIAVHGMQKYQKDNEHAILKGLASVIQKQTTPGWDFRMSLLLRAAARATKVEALGRAWKAFLVLLIMVMGFVLAWIVTTILPALLIVPFPFEFPGEPELYGLAVTVNVLVPATIMTWASIGGTAFSIVTWGLFTKVFKSASVSNDPTTGIRGTRLVMLGHFPIFAIEIVGILILGYLLDKFTFVVFDWTYDEFLFILLILPAIFGTIAIILGIISRVMVSRGCRSASSGLIAATQRDAPGSNPASRLGI
jgi:hypothetical protein